METISLNKIVFNTNCALSFANTKNVKTFCGYLICMHTGNQTINCCSIGELMHLASWPNKGSFFFLICFNKSCQSIEFLQLNTNQIII